MALRASHRGAFFLLVGSPLLTAWGTGTNGQRSEALVAPESTRSAAAKPGAARTAAAFPKPSGFRIAGHVVDAHGDPIADAEIWLEDMSGDGGAKAPVWLGADSNGRFTTPETRAALYTVTASARGFAPRALAVELHRDIEDLGVALAQAPSPRAVVLDPEGRAVPDAVVIACSESAEVTLHSAADGTVVFAPGAIGCSVRAHHGRFGRSAPARLRSEGVTALRLERAGSIEGVVTDSSGRALFDCEVSVSAFDPSEDERALAGTLPELRAPLGREFRFSGLAPGGYSLTVSRRIRVEDEVSVEELSTASFEVQPGRVLRAVHIVVDLRSAESPE